MSPHLLDLSPSWSKEMPPRYPKTLARRAAAVMTSSWWTTLPERVEGSDDPAEAGDAVEDPRDGLGARPDGRSRSIALQPGELHPGIPVHADKRHRLLHYPTSESCHACRIANVRNVRHEQKKPDADEPPVDKFGQHVTMDFIIAKAPKFEEISGFENALLIYDVGTGWMQLYPTVARTTGEVIRCLEHATGHNEEIRYVYSDGATEFVSACRKLESPQARPFTSRRPAGERNHRTTGPDSQTRRSSPHGAVWPPGLLCLLGNSGIPVRLQHD